MASWQLSLSREPGAPAGDRSLGGRPSPEEGGLVVFDNTTDCILELLRRAHELLGQALLLIEAAERKPG